MANAESVIVPVISFELNEVFFADSRPFALSCSQNWPNRSLFILNSYGLLGEMRALDLTLWRIVTGASSLLVVGRAI